MKNSEWREAFQALATAYFRATGDLWPLGSGEPLKTAVKSALITDQVVADLYKNGMREREIAELLECSEGTVSSRLRRAGVQSRTLHDYPETPAQKAARQKLAHRERGPLSLETRSKISAALRGRGEFGGGEYETKNGYVMVYAPEHPRANAGGFVPKHTLVVEKRLGRYLRDDEVAHHINHKRNDNRDENLAVMDRRDHCRMHGREARAN